MDQQIIWNYVAKAHDDVAGIILGAARRGAPETASAIQAIWGVALRSPKFAMPVNGKLLMDDFRGLPDGFRLPYPEIVIEYPVSDGGPGSNANPEWAHLKAGKRIVVVQERQIGDFVDVPGFIDRSRDSHPDATHIIFVQAICEVDLPGEPPFWTPVWSMATLLNARRPGEKYFTVDCKPIDCELGEMVAAEHRRKGLDIGDTAAQDIMHETVAVLELCEALACSNVSDEVVHAPAKLNAKRQRAGKRPLDDYHVLVVNSARGAKRQHSTGHSDRASPRQHLRRGHIRIYDSGLRIWVNATVVGDARRGQVGKSYAVRPPAAPAP